MSDNYDILKGNFISTFTTIEQYQHKYPFLIGNLRCKKYQKDYVPGGRNDIKLKYMKTE